MAVVVVPVKVVHHHLPTPSWSDPGSAVCPRNLHVPGAGQGIDPGTHDFTDQPRRGLAQDPFRWVTGPTSAKGGFAPGLIMAQGLRHPAAAQGGPATAWLHILQGEERDDDMAMQLCEVHSQALRDELSATPLVTHMEDRDKNPVLFAVWRISSNFLAVVQQQLGWDPELLQRFQHPFNSVCPICWVNEKCECDETMCAEWWVKYATQDALDEFEMV